MADVKGWVKGSWVLSVHLVSNEVRAEAANPIIRPPLSLSLSLFSILPSLTLHLSLPTFLSIYLLSIYPSRSRYVDAASYLYLFVPILQNQLKSLHLLFFYFFYFIRISYYFQSVEENKA